MISRPISTASVNNEAAAVIGMHSPGCTRRSGVGIDDRGSDLAKVIAAVEFNDGIEVTDADDQTAARINRQIPLVTITHLSRGILIRWLTLPQRAH